MAYIDKYKQKLYIDSWREKNKEHIAEYNNEYRKENKEKIRLAKKEWADRNKEYISNYSKEYYKKHQEERKRYAKYYRDKNQKLVANAVKKWKENNDFYIKQKQREYDNLRFFGGNKYKVLERDRYECQLCKNRENLHIHHIDNNKKNNDMNNLITLCISCHTEIHHWQRREKLNYFLDFESLILT